MTRRVRFTAALLALIGFTAFFAESLVAVTCSPLMTMPEAADMAGHEGMQHTMPDEPAAGSEPDSPEMPHCPLTLIAGSSCTAAALPAATGMVVLSAPAHEGVTDPSGTGATLLLVEPFFPPPRG